MAEPTRIYLASSWRNPRYPVTLERLRMAGFEVYDFRDPESTFQWKQIDPGWADWKPEEIRQALDHPLTGRAFDADRDAIAKCDALVMLMPCGASAHMELGYAAGLGKQTVIVLAHTVTPAEKMTLTRPECMYLGGGGSAEVMYLLADYVCLSIGDAIAALLNGGEDIDDG